MSVKFKGIPFLLDGQEYIIPSLSLKQFQDNYEALSSPIEKTAAGDLSDQFKRYVPIILLAIKRNYPDVTEQNLYDWLDLATYRDVFLAVQAASGLKAAAPGE